jgi:hypothetical protein
MKKLPVELSNRKGFTLILSILLMTVFIGAAAFAVDVGHQQLRRADVHAAADAAALAGIEEFSATSLPDSALNEAQAFAARFQADASHLRLAAADFALGFWNGTTFSPGGADTNAAQVTVRYNGTYTFAPMLGIASHESSATAVAVGTNKSVTQSECVAPAVISYQQLLDQLGGGKTMADSLTASDIAKLSKATASDAVALSIPNGTKVSSLDVKAFYQINVPPSETADGTIQNSGPPSASDYRNGADCTGGGPAIGVGDWVQPINGQKAQKTKQAINGLTGSLPVTIQVIIADKFSAHSPNGGCPNGPGAAAVSGCFQVRYLGAFTVTATAGKGISGYFTLLDAKGGVTATSTSPGPLVTAKTHLVY